MNISPNASDSFSTSASSEIIFVFQYSMINLNTCPRKSTKCSFINADTSPNFSNNDSRTFGSEERSLLKNGGMINGTSGAILFPSSSLNI